MNQSFDRATRQAVLSEAPLFRSLPPEGVERLALLGRAERFPSGAALMRQGEPSTEMYVLARGRVQVERMRADAPLPLLLAELGPSDVVGEMGLLDREPRSATVTALEETEAVALNGTALSLILLEYPTASRELLRMVSRRLRDIDELAEAMLEGALGVAAR